MGFFKNLINLTIVETVCNTINSNLKKKRNDEKKKDIEKMEKLKELYDSGAITEKEYKKMKKNFLLD